MAGNLKNINKLASQQVHHPPDRGIEPAGSQASKSTRQGSNLRHGDIQ